MGVASALDAEVGTVQMRSSDLSSFRSSVLTVVGDGFARRA